MSAKDQLCAANFKDIFKDCVKQEPDGTLVFSSDMLYSKWFRKYGSSYYFLFRQNLSRTNIQFAELLSLIRLHTETKDARILEHDLHFVMVSDFIDKLRDVVNDIAHAPISIDTLCDTVLDLYSEVFRCAILLDVFHGSCSVFFPPHLKLRLFEVCAESGYVHSCGYNVYARKLSLGDDADFKQAVGFYLKEHYPDRKVFFVVYSHEDFSAYDREYAAELRGGLEEVKIYAEKYFLGKQPLVKVLRELQRKHADSLLLAEAGDYRRHPKQRRKAHIDAEHTMWLIIDRVAREHSTMPGEEQFLICYDQQFINENPLHIFDENKPAWIAHTTIPHTLAGAMLNITRPDWPVNEAVNLYDPFSGTGTFALEASKLPNTRVTSNDISAIASLLLQDNFTFFGPDNKYLREAKDSLKQLSKCDCSEYSSGPTFRTIQSTYDIAIALFEKVSTKEQGSGQWFDIPADIVKTIKEQNFNVRLRFYLALRTELRHVAAFERGSEQWVTAYSKEARILLKQVKRLLGLRNRIIDNNVGTFSKTRGTYSIGCTINPQSLEISALISNRLFITSNDLAEDNITSDDAAEDKSNAEYDVIISDPPYGLNNEMNPQKLAELLTRSISVCLQQLKPSGQLVIALPDRSHSGRHVPVFATAEWVTQQVIAKATEIGFEAMVPAAILPRVGKLFQPPYYWNSEKALKRAILHFRFQKMRPLRHGARSLGVFHNGPNKG